MTKAEQTRLMTLRCKMLQTGGRSAPNVARTCRHFGISRKTFYKWKRRTPPTARPACRSAADRTDRRARPRATSSARSSICASSIISGPAGSPTT